MMQIPRTGMTHRPDIDGLRGVAILLVVLYHAGLPGLAGGYVGVDVFFVLSGYLISGLLVEELQQYGKIDLLKFYARRARRLVPAAALMTIVMLVAGGTLYAPLEQAEAARSAIASSLYVSNITFASRALDYLAAGPASDPFLHTWSLGVEEQFYLIWPLLMVLFLPRLRRSMGLGSAFGTILGALGVASFVLSAWMTGYAQPRAFFGSPYRLWEFAVGGLAVLLTWRPSATLTDDSPAHAAGTGPSRAASPAVGFIGMAGGILILVPATVFDDHSPFPGTIALLPALGTALVLAGSASTTGLVPRVLGSTPMRWIGRRSYSWYLWHWPMIAIAAMIHPNSAPARFAAAVLALALANLTLVMLEDPLRKSEWLRARPGGTVLGAVTVIGAGAMLAYGARTLAAAAAAAPSQAAFTMARNDVPVVDRIGCLLEEEDVIVTSRCVFGDSASLRTVVLWGDSHASQWFPALDNVARRQGLVLAVVTKVLCPPADVEPFSVRLRRRGHECGVWRRMQLRRIAAMRPVAVVATGADFYVSAGGTGPLGVSADEWRDGMRRTLSALDAAGVPVVLLRDAPLAGFDVPTCLARGAAHPRWAAPCEFRRETGMNLLARSAADSAVTGLRLASIVDLTADICRGDRCRVQDRGVVIYSDEQHLKSTYVMTRAADLDRVLRAAIARR